MELSIPQKKKHLLLLNRIIRAETKNELIPVPSKLTESEVNSYFNKLFVKKDDYYIPVKNKMEIAIDEDLFKNLIKKPKAKMTAEDKQKEKESKTKAMADVFIRMSINPYLRKEDKKEDSSKELKMMVDKFVKLKEPVKNNIKKRWARLYASILGPADETRKKRKANLKEEEMKLNDEIKKEKK